MPLNVHGQRTKPFSGRLLAWKWLGTFFSMLSGLFIGPEGPIIHIGAAFGRQAVNAFRRGYILRNIRWLYLQPAERRDFMAIGAGAGIAAAFSAPLAGTLFVVEEAASSVHKKLVQLSFFACVLAYLITWLLTKEDDGHVKFSNPQTVYCRSYAFIDIFLFLIVGILGGMVGGIFNVINLRINKFRSQYINQFWKRRMVEVLLLVVTTCAVSVAFTHAWPCTPSDALLLMKDSSGCMEYKDQEQVSFGIVTDDFAYGVFGTAPLNLTEQIVSASSKSGSLYLPFLENPEKIKVSYTLSADCGYEGYNEMGSLLLQSGITAVKSLLRRGMPHLYSATTLILFFFVYFLLAVVTSGSAVPSGLFIPHILIGASLGRLFGLAWLRLIHRKCAALDGYDESKLTPFDWVFGGYLDTLVACRVIDPGAFAIVGASAVLGGSGQITVFLTLVMWELTDDIKLMPPIMLSVFAARWAAKPFCKGLYHELAHQQGIPLLNKNPPYLGNFYPVTYVMVKENLKTLPPPEEITKAHLEACLQSSHNAFPVVSKTKRLNGAVTSAEGKESGSGPGHRREWSHANKGHSPSLKVRVPRSLGELRGILTRQALLEYLMESQEEQKLLERESKTLKEDGLSVASESFSAGLLPSRSVLAAQDSSSSSSLSDAHAPASIKLSNLDPSSDLHALNLGTACYSLQ